ncbi:MAG: hypothetical protein R3336_02890, partial [Phycisphaeraceae bacterium]|nr:hypothetical protein [Phycisphaeraceae bacterium]
LAEGLADLVDHLVCLPTGPEVVTGSTRMKAGTATKLALNMISTAAMVRRGKTWGHLMVDLAASNDKLVDRAERILMTTLGLDREAAGKALNAADGRVKIALVMQRLDVNRETAERRLAETDGHLAPLIGPAPGA